jgi:heme/copper-type cytochrome/quinol oxidase subunit 2
MSATNTSLSTRTTIAIAFLIVFTFAAVLVIAMERYCVRKQYQDEQRAIKHHHAVEVRA